MTALGWKKHFVRQCNGKGGYTCHPAKMNVLPRFEGRQVWPYSMTMMDNGEVITNWARKLSIQTVQHLAGHSNIETTRKYYLSVQQDDLAVARELQSKLMAPLTNYGAK